jgi:hypothetical protein
MKQELATMLAEYQSRTGRWDMEGMKIRVAEAGAERAAVAAAALAAAPMIVG